MVTQLGIEKQSLYETDYLQWIETTVEKLRSHRRISQTLTGKI